MLLRCISIRRLSLCGCPPVAVVVLQQSILVTVLLVYSFRRFASVEVGCAEVSRDRHHNRYQCNEFKRPDIVECPVAVFDAISAGSLTGQRKGYCVFVVVVSKGKRRAREKNR